MLSRARRAASTWARTGSGRQGCSRLGSHGSVVGDLQLGPLTWPRGHGIRPSRGPRAEGC